MFGVLSAVMGFLGAVVGCAIVSEQGGRLGLGWAGLGFGAGVASCVVAVVAHEAAHAVGIRLTGYRGQIRMFLAEGGQTEPIYVGGRKKAAVALAGPAVDLSSVFALSVAWSVWSDGALGVVLGVSAAVTVVLFLISVRERPNDLSIAKESWGE